MTSELYKTVLLCGAPGAGKGTQGKILGSIPGFFHLSCGDVFRTININSELGQKICAYTARGDLVPDDITVELWQENMNARTVLNDYKPNTDLLVLDGIPRNAEQAERIARSLAGYKKRFAEPARTADKESSSAFATEEIVSQAFLRTLSRYPSDEELRRSVEYVNAEENKINGVRGLVWALLNTKEFIVNH